MRRIVIDIYDHTTADALDETLAAIRGIGLDARLVDIPAYEGGKGTNTAISRGIVYAAQQYRVEFRVDVEANTPEDAERVARERVAEDGEVTAVFDEEWEEQSPGAVLA